MTQDDDDLTHQDEEIDATHFEVEERRDAHNFGNWPELAGLVFAIAVIWYSFNFTG